MNTGRISAALAAAGLMTTVGLVAAADKDRLDAGKREYMSNCSVCHGVAGKGDGAVIDLLKAQPSDLTTLSKRNGGVFPFEHVYAVIDGREAVKGHGPRDMPIWGSDYSRQGVRAAEYYVDMPYDMEMYVRARIISLIDYLHRIQTK